MSASVEIRNKILISDAIETLRSLPPNCVDCIVTSPPYWGLRNYGVDGQMGLEATPEQYVQNMVAVFEEARRVLKDTGTLWLNIGDSYAGSGKGSATHPANNAAWKQDANSGTHSKSVHGYKTDLLKPKDLVGIPWMLAFALRAAGWHLRMDIIWSKPNPMPESVHDRPTKAHEYIFLLTKKAHYYYDAEAIKTQGKNLLDDERRMNAVNNNHKSKPNTLHNRLRDKQRGHSRKHAGFNERWDNLTKEEQCLVGANKRSVWEVATKPYKEAHFATFPPDLIVPCIKAGSSEHGVCQDCGKPWERVVEKELVPTAKATQRTVVDSRDLNADAQDQGSNRAKSGHKPAHIYESKTTGWRSTCKCGAGTVPALVLDPFGGSCTTAEGAAKLGRDYLMIELNEAYVSMGNKRLRKALGLFHKDNHQLG